MRNPIPSLPLRIALLSAATFLHGLAAVAQPTLLSARSEMRHGSNSYYALDLPLTGPRGVEGRLPRDGGTVVILTFDGVPATIGSMETSHGQIQPWSGIREDYPGQVAVFLDNLPDDGYHLTVTVNDVADASGTLSRADATVGMLIGDVDATGSVNVTDIRRVASRSGQQAGNEDNFKLDPDLTGTINVADIRRVASRSGRRLPAAAPFFVGSLEDHQTTPGVATPAQPVTLDDFDTPAANLTLAATSSNPTLLPTSGITLAGSGANRSVTLQPAPGQTGTATLTLTVSDGSQSATTTFSLTVSNNTPPQAIAAAGNYLGNAPLTTTFDARRSNDSDGNIAFYAWDFGDGTTGSGVAPGKTYTTPGTYNATLTVVDNGGLTDTLTHAITVADGSFDVNATPSRADASRFLWSAAFGPDPDDLEDVQDLGYAGWIDQQAGASPNLLTESFKDYIRAETGNMDDTNNQKQMWFQFVTDGEDQLRQRMAFALSQILVINNEQDNTSYTGSADYYNAYITEGLGNFRDLLEHVTFSFPMANYLTYLDNQKANPVTGTTPDENFAREIMQLFSVGLVELNLDGTPKRDAQGRVVPTYDNETIKAFSRVFTGLRLSSVNSGADAYQRNMAEPLKMELGFHDFGVKQLLTYNASAAGPAALNGGVQTAKSVTVTNGLADVQFAIDNVFNHPNVAPFVCKQLIQRLVTSNPTPAYVERVARVFVNNGSGERGDLLAVARAILLDPEARDPAYRNHPVAGRIIEPQVAQWGIYRALEIYESDSRDGHFDPQIRVWYQGYSDQDNFAQDYLASPSVFNFYLPDYVQPGSELDRRGLVAPELQITNTITVLARQDQHSFRGPLNFGNDGESTPRLFDSLEALVPGFAQTSPELITGADAVIDELAVRLLGRPISPEARVIIRNAMLENANYPNGRVRAATYLIIGSPEFTIRN